MSSPDPAVSGFRRVRWSVVRRRRRRPRRGHRRFRWRRGGGRCLDAGCGRRTTADGPAGGVIGAAAGQAPRVPREDHDPWRRSSSEVRPARVPSAKQVGISGPVRLPGGTASQSRRHIAFAEPDRTGRHDPTPISARPGQRRRQGRPLRPSSPPPGLATAAPASMKPHPGSFVQSEERFLDGVGRFGLTVERPRRSRRTVGVVGHRMPRSGQPVPRSTSVAPCHVIGDELVALDAPTPSHRRGGGPNGLIAAAPSSTMTPAWSAGHAVNPTSGRRCRRWHCSATMRYPTCHPGGPGRVDVGGGRRTRRQLDPTPISACSAGSTALAGRSRPADLRADSTKAWYNAGSHRSAAVFMVSAITTLNTAPKNAQTPRTR
jgi:hypothetical protein